jgi:hypothetical protein
MNIMLKIGKLIFLTVGSILILLALFLEHASKIKKIALKNKYVSGKKKNTVEMKVIPKPKTI